MNSKGDTGDSGLVAFVSHSHIDREFAGQAKEVLSDAGMEAFVAHDDIEVSEEWQLRIREELSRCHLFVPLLSKNFLESQWTLQEVGFIASRSDVKIAPLSIDGAVPFGFISHFQSGRILSDGITCKLLVEPLAKHFPGEIHRYLIRRVGNAHSFWDAESKMSTLVPLFKLLTKAEAQDLAEAAADNSQVWAARMCRDDYLPAFIQIHRGNIKGKTRRALEHQIKTATWYSPE